MQTYRLSLPPSTNDLLRPAIIDDLRCPYCNNRPPKRPLVRLVATGEAKDFRKHAHRHLPVAPVGGPVELYATVYLPTLSSDGLNRIKALEDAVNERLWFDDKQIGEWHIKRIITDDESKHGVAFSVGLLDPFADPDHAELARRLARSTIGQRANEAAQPKLFPEPTEGGPSTGPAAGRVKPSDARGGAGVGAPRPRAVLAEPLQQKLNRIAKSAVVPHRPPDEDPEVKP